MQLTKNFHLSEFNCKDGTVVPEDLMDNAKELAKALQIIRDFIDEPMDLNSVYRHPQYNKDIGGGSQSQHLLCKAADIDCDELSFNPKQLARIIKGLISLGLIPEGGIGIYTSDNFVHYDIRKQKARWKG